ncbi:MAG: hypothetical protein WCW68_00435 [Methanothrix sp.]
MPEILDEIDKKLLRRCSEYPGSTLAGLIAPLQEEISPRPSARTMYDRLGELEVRGFIDVDRTARRGRSLAKITGKGKDAIE